MIGDYSEKFTLDFNDQKAVEESYPNEIEPRTEDQMNKTNGQQYEDLLYTQLYHSYFCPDETANEAAYIDPNSTIEENSTIDLSNGQTYFSYNLNETTRQQMNQDVGLYGQNLSIEPHEYIDLTNRTLGQGENFNSNEQDFHHQQSMNEQFQSEILEQNHQIQRINDEEVQETNDIILVNVDDHSNQYCENELFTAFNQITSESIVWNNNYNRISPGSGVASLNEQSNVEEGEELNLFNESSLFNVSINICLICGDKATGKHYGAQSCDGCKGFFRRSVRKSHQYQCRYNKDCVIDKDKRNQCRFCRLKKCFNVGMKKSAVQNERDKISTRKNLNVNSLEKQIKIEIQELLSADQKAKYYFPEYFSSFLTEIKSMERIDFDILRIPGVISKTQDYLFYWMSQIRFFTTLSFEEKKILFDEKISELVILDSIFQIKDGHQASDLTKDPLNCKNKLSAFAAPYNTNICSDIIIKLIDLLDNISTLLTIPLDELMLDPDEVISFKALVMFDPYCKNLSKSTREILMQIRHYLQIELQSYMNEKTYMTEGRFGDLLILLPNIREMGNKLQEIMNSFSNIQVDAVQ